MTRYRPVSQAEIPIIADIQAAAFRGDPQRYLESYQEGARMDWRALRLLDDPQGRPLAALTYFSRAMSLNGGELPAGLLGSVAVPPHLRRRGYGRQLMQGVLEEMHAHSAPISLLFPFSVAWYRGLGYGMAGFSHHITLPITLLPDSPERLAVRRAGSGDEPGIRECYRLARQRPAHNGWLARTDWEWHNRLWKQREHERVVYEVDGRIEGYLVYKLTWSASEASARVVEWVWTSDAAWRGLAGLLGSLGDQARELIYHAPPHDPLLHALPQPYDWSRAPLEFVFFPVAQLASGFMLRIVHLPEALRQRRYPQPLQAEFLLQVDDPQLPANSHPIHCRIANSVCQASLHDESNREAAGMQARKPTNQPTNQPTSKPTNIPLIRTNIATFSELYAGFLSAEQARILGHLDADDPTCAALTAAFAAAPLHMWQADWF